MTRGVPEINVAALQIKEMKEKELRTDDLHSGEVRRRAVGRIESLEFAQTSWQEIGGPTAAHHILNRRTFISTHNLCQLHQHTSCPLQVPLTKSGAG